MGKGTKIAIGILYGVILVSSIGLGVISSITPTVPSIHGEIFHSHFNKS